MSLLYQLPLFFAGEPMTKSSDNMCEGVDKVAPQVAPWKDLIPEFWSAGAFSILHPRKDGLTEQQTKDALQIEKDILSANLPQLTIDMRAHAGHGEEIKPVMEKVIHDLRAKGILVGYSAGKMMWGDEHKMHSEGYLEIVDRKGRRELEVGTDPKLGVSVEPMKKLDDGSLSACRGYFGGYIDPADTLRAIAGKTHKASTDFMTCR